MAVYDIVCETCGKARRVSRAWHQAKPRYCSNACRFDRNGRTFAEVLERFTDRSGGPDACWEFKGPRNPAGYGLVFCDDEKQFAHRLAWMLKHGPIPEGMMVCHRCDNPPCRNEGHLFLGTATVNAADRHTKAREPKGDGHRGSRLREEDIPAIRALEGTMSAVKVGAIYGVDNTTIHCVWKRKTWNHVP